jgi:hypothetical protein
MQLAEHLERVGSRLGRMGEQRNAGLLEETRRGVIALMVKLELMSIIE